jgi:hypothetical protein
MLLRGIAAAEECEARAVAICRAALVRDFGEEAAFGDREGERVGVLERRSQHGDAFVERGARVFLVRKAARQHEHDFLHVAKRGLRQLEVRDRHGIERAGQDAEPRWPAPGIANEFHGLRFGLAPQEAAGV